MLVVCFFERFFSKHMNILDLLIFFIKTIILIKHVFSNILLSEKQL